MNQKKPLTLGLAARILYGGGLLICLTLITADASFAVRASHRALPPLPAAVGGMRNGLNPVQISLALNFRLHEALSVAASSAKLAQLLCDRLAAPNATAEDRFAVQLLGRALSDPAALSAIQEFVRRVDVPGEARINAHLGDSLGELAAPYHRSDAMRRKFSVSMKWLSRRLPADFSLGSPERLNAMLASFYDGSLPSEGEPVVSATGLLQTDAASARKKSIPLEKPAAKRRAAGGSKSRAVIVAQDSSIMLKERIELQDRFSQFPTLYFIGQKYIDHHYYRNDEAGDHLQVYLYPKGNPFDPGSSQKGMGGQSAPGAVALYSGKALAQYSDMDRQAMLRKYVQDVYSSNPLPPDTVEFVVKSLLHDQETMEKAKEYWLRVQEQGEIALIELANEGLKRYFRFVPAGWSAPVDARVLDIHRQNNPHVFFILVEWMSEANDDGVRTRHISLLKSSELEMVSVLSDEVRRLAAEAFEDSLSPNEIKTRKLAQTMRIRTFGYTDMDRVPGNDDSDGLDPLSMMSNISHLAVRGYVEDRFGSIQDLMTPEERQQPLANILDVMGRLNPRYVLRRFESRGDGYQYAFVVTEDGQLKISPHGRAGVNLKPQSLRLAHGRRVFAAGTFTIGADGNLDVTLESNNFQDVDARWGAGEAFRTAGNGDIDAFVTAVFGLQTDHKVRSVGSRPVQSYRASPYGDPYSKGNAGFADGGGARRRQGPHGFESDEAYEFVNNMMRESAQTPSAKKIDWDFDDPDASPLDIKGWLKDSERPAIQERDKKTRLAWAHYVLRTSADMSMEQIKKAYRQLALRFHPDRNPRFAKSDAAWIVNMAFETIDKDLKDMVGGRPGL